MEILKNAGSFEILSVTKDVISDIAETARTCYQSKGHSKESADISLVRNLIKRGHSAMLEFADMRVRFNNICRGFTHELVRHRLASYAQESTRYVDESDFKCVVPPHKNEDEQIIEIDVPNNFKQKISLKQWFKLNEQVYRSLRKNEWKPEDARQVLPIAIKSQIVIKANMTEWRHIFKMRCDHYAHWEIRSIMLQLLNDCKKNIPVIFDDFIFYSKLNKDLELHYFDDLSHQLVVKEEIYARNY